MDGAVKQATKRGLSRAAGGCSAHGRTPEAAEPPGFNIELRGGRQLRLAIEETQAEEHARRDAEKPAADPDAPACPPEPAAKRSRKGQHPGRAPLPEHLPREERRHTLSEDERRCECCGGLKEAIRKEATDRLDYRPASLRIVFDVIEAPSGWPWSSVDFARRVALATHRLPTRGIFSRESPRPEGADARWLRACPAWWTGGAPPPATPACSCMHAHARQNVIRPACTEAGACDVTRSLDIELLGSENDLKQPLQRQNLAWAC